MIVKYKVLHALSGIFIWLAERSTGKVQDKFGLLACKCLDKELEIMCKSLTGYID